MASLEKWMKFTAITLRLCAGCTLLILVRPLSADDWTQFRGPNATGVYTGQERLPVEPAQVPEPLPLA